VLITEYSGVYLSLEIYFKSVANIRYPRLYARKMLKLRFYFLYASVVCNLYGLAKSQDNRDTVCLLKDAPNQCGAFCLTAQRPFIDHNQKVWKQLNMIALQLKETQEKLDSLRSETMMNFERIEAKMQNRPAEVQTTRLPATKSIPPEFDRIGSRFFYIERNDKQNWFDAEVSCLALGGHLAAVQDENEFAALDRKLMRNTFYWLGINDREEEGHFVSVASGKASPFLYWSNGTSNINGHESCTVMFNGEMMDMGCHKTTICFFICQSDDEV